MALSRKNNPNQTNVRSKGYREDLESIKVNRKFWQIVVQLTEISKKF
jgi:hypothetical protein